MQEYKNPSPEDGAPKREFSRPPRKVSKPSEQKVFQSHSSVADGLKRGPKAPDPIRAEASEGHNNPLSHHAGRVHGGKGHGGFRNETREKFSPKSPSQSPSPHREGYFKNAGPKGGKVDNAPVGPGASFVSIPKFRSKRNFPFVTPAQALKKHAPYPEHKAHIHAPKDTLRIVPFGGLEQVGLNCIGFEYDNEILIVDMGLQFADQYQF